MLLRHAGNTMNKKFGSKSKAAILHLAISSAVAGLSALLVFLVWYPYPYRELSGGRELFLLVVGVDVVCGPILTFVLFSPFKPRTELRRDLRFVALIQLAALVYGLFTVWQARPLFLVMEMDRFKVVTSPDLDQSAVAALPANLRSSAWAGPKVVAIRPPASVEEKNRVLFAAIQGGRDYAERPEFYLPYESDNALKSLKAAKPLAAFLARWPDQQAAADKLAVEKKADMTQWLYLPVRGRQEWVAVLDKQGQIQGFLKGDGF